MTRRVVIAAVALALAAPLLRGALASSLVVRGDDVLRSAGAARALAYYERAAFVDAGNAQAADRVAFAATMLGGAALRRHARAAVARAVARHPGDVALRFDAALLDVKARRFHVAREEFADLAREGSMPAARQFAAALARREDRSR